MPLHRRLPKRGFTNIFKKQYAIVNLRDLEDFSSGRDDHSETSRRSAATLRTLETA